MGWRTLHQPPLTLASGDVAVWDSLDKIRADEFCAMLIIAEEQDLLEREKLLESGAHPRR